MSENGCCMMGTKDAIARYGLKELIDCSNNHFGIPSDPSLSYFDHDSIMAKEMAFKINKIYGVKEEKEMGNEKIITLIGSMSEVNKAAMIALFNRLTLKGDLVHLPYMDRVSEDVSDDQIETLHNLHEYKMGKADLVIVVDADGHIGKDTQREIDWCNGHGKNIIYLSDMLACDFLRPNYCDNIRPSDMRTKGGKKS